MEKVVIEGAIFDMDGLMFDTESIWAELWPVALAEHGYGCTQEFLHVSLGVNREVQEQLIREHFGQDAPAAQIFDLEEELINERLRHDVPIKPGLPELLAWLEQHEVPLAVASGSPMYMIEDCLKAAGVRERFDVLFSADGMENGKPAPDVFLLAAEALGVEPTRTLVLEDSFLGVRAGHAGNFITVMVPDQVPPTEEILELADACCDNLHQVVELLEAGKLE